ncbi:MAG TPA: hypothetical protein VIM73_03740 [Polyangiaceae bacterium]
MASSRALLRPLLVGLGAFLVFQACSASNGTDGEDSTRPGGGSGGGPGGAGGAKVVMPDAGTPPGGEGGETALDPLCGLIACNPDDAESCAEFVPAEPASQVFTLGGAGGEGGASGASGATGFAGESAGGTTGVSGGGGLGPAAAGEGGRADGPAPEYACRVTGLEPSATECLPSGKGGAGAACFSSRDCASGLVCVDSGVVGQCRPFCCAGESSCDAFSGTYCAPRLVLDEPEREEPLRVPVCVVADDCDLAQPPCDREGECECPPDTACQVVRADGLTACAPDGEGTAGQACPCAYGHVCSQAVQRCLALCRTDGKTGGAMCERCQGSAELPDGWGVCID